MSSASLHPVAVMQNNPELSCQLGMRLPSESGSCCQEYSDSVSMGSSDPLCLGKPDFRVDKPDSFHQEGP